MALAYLANQNQVPVPTVPYPDVLRGVYKLRQEDLGEAIEGLQGDLDEVEAVLGSAAAEPLRTTLRKACDVFSLLAVCASSRSGETDPARSLDDSKKRILMASEQSEDDEFGTELDAILERTLETIARFK